MLDTSDGAFGLIVVVGLLLGVAWPAARWGRP